MYFMFLQTFYLFVTFETLNIWRIYLNIIHEIWLFPLKLFLIHTVYINIQNRDINQFTSVVILYFKIHTKYASHMSAPIQLRRNVISDNPENICGKITGQELSRVKCFPDRPTLHYRCVVRAPAYANWCITMKLLIYVLFYIYVIK